jgi:hypothetical protein
MTGSLLDISGEDIAALGDGDLRSLVARLCEAEIRRRDFPTSAVTAGGQQEAKDGGVDVRVALPASTVISGYVPRAATGFQVKKSDMPPKAIAKEMRPKGKLRPILRELAAEGGAYIIVSSNGSTSDSALRKRREAMAHAVKGVKGAPALHLDFYDRERIASWLRDHPGLLPWVRHCIGKGIRGWQSYGAWANPAETIDAEYLVDDKKLVRTGNREEGEGISGLEGLARVRKALREPRNIVRLVGLSGVGKTRFVQALFDELIGNGALDPSLALYANLGDDPDPQPVGMVSDLIAGRSRAIVIIDNCPPDLHKRLSEVCRAAASTVSVITVEYDIREDTPEETEVIRIEPSSVALIEKLIKRRFPGVSQVDAGTVATLSGGNARVAIALAGTIKKHETISGLGDEELFQRLFEQRHGHNEPLLLVAQACSLVYSFEGEAVSGDHAELPIFADLIGSTAATIYQAVSELKRRDLVQQRGVWRAVLPHAIAKRLAAMALQNFPIPTIEAHLVNGASERVLKSFSRRLGYLDDSPQAVALVTGWLAHDGLLGDVTRLTELGKAMLQNVAPIAPEALLGVLERAPPDAVTDHAEFARLLRSLAYDPALFARSMGLLAAMAEADASAHQSEAGSCFEGLFFVYLSGTRAPVDMRLAVVETQLRSTSARRAELGLNALRAMLEAWHFSSGAQFEFGSRSRDYGYWPRTTAELQSWYAAVLKFAERYAVGKDPIAAQVRTIIGKKFRGLWTKAGMYDDLDRLCHAIRKAGFWREGWVGVKETLRFDAMSAKAKARLQALEKLLQPADLVETVRSVVVARGGLELDDFDVVDDDTNTASELQRRDAIAVALGVRTAGDEEAFKELLPELTRGDGRLSMFGRGLARGADDPDTAWQALTSEFRATEENARNSAILSGFLAELNASDPKHAARLLDEALADPVLGAHFPELQRAVLIDTRGVARLIQALDKTPVRRFHVLASGGVSNPIAGSDLRALLETIAARPDGLRVAADILDMRLFSDQGQKKPVDPELIAAGRDLLDTLTFDKRERDDDHKIGSLVGRCLKEQDGATTAQRLCQRLMSAISARETHAYLHDRLVAKLFKVQPVAMLDTLFAGSATEKKIGLEIMHDVTSMDKPNPIDAVPQEELLAWCERDRDERYPVMASVATLFRQEGGKALEWSDTAQALLRQAPDPLAVLKRYVGRFRPESWSGSLAAAMEAPLTPLRTLEEDPNAAIAEFAKAEGRRLRQEIERVRRHETEEDRQTDERFE